MKNLFPILYLIPIGLLVSVTGLVLKHFMNIPDAAYGSIMGAGIGIMLFALYKQKRIGQIS